MSRRAAFWWTLFALGTVVILAIVPYANAVEKSLRDQFGREALRWGTIGLVAVAAAGVVFWLVRRRPAPDRLVWLLLVPAVTMAWMVKLSVPAEAVHLLEYGLIGALAARALACRLHGASVYLAAAALTALVGAFDELVQWLVPGRIWGLHDIGLNAAGGVLVQLWIGLGVRPSWVAGRLTPRSLLAAWRLAAILLAGSLVLVVIPALDS